MIERRLAECVRARATRYPVVTLTGPRQSGKTTLCRSVFPDKAYLSLEDPDVREEALEDPRGLLSRHPEGCILDEIQRAPDLPSYIQGIVDERRENGLYVLSGSQHLGLVETVSQSLAGRTTVVELLPLGLDEIRRFGRETEDLFETLWTGAYPAIFDRGIPPSEWYADYVTTYVERDVRQVLNVGNLGVFQRFLRLAAGRTAQLLNLSGIGADTGVTYNTIQAWISVLEATFIAFRLPPMAASLRKRLVKTPKLCFFDTGLLCYLLGIRSPEDLRTHPLRGAVFETWVIAQIYKARAHRGLAPDLSFYRDRAGLEVDALVQLGSTLLAVEAKSGATIAADFFKPMNRFAETAGQALGHLKLKKVLVHGGGPLETTRESRGATLLPWRQIDSYPWVP